MKIKIEFEFDLEYFEDWCNTKFTEEDIEKIRNYLNHVDEVISYKLRDFINENIRNE